MPRRGSVVTRTIHPELNPVIEAIETVVYGKREAVGLVLTALLARGHALIEDAPGMGKTRLAYAVARALSLSFKRVQFTSDLLPSDILGVSVFSPETREFNFKKGPIFCNLLFADELNRTPPKTQSALLEAMNEKQVSMDGYTYPLEEPFCVLATQNPAEYHGTYPLPESQVDRFLLRLQMGYPDREAEARILEDTHGLHEFPVVPPRLSREALLKLQNHVPSVRVDRSLRDYLLTLVRRTREDERVLQGASPRAAKSLYIAAQAYALLQGRDYCVPDDVKSLVIPCFIHRIVLKTTPQMFEADQSEKQKVAFLRDILEQTPVPK